MYEFEKTKQQSAFRGQCSASSGQTDPDAQFLATMAHKGREQITDSIKGSSSSTRRNAGKASNAPGAPVSSPAAAPADFPIDFSALETARSGKGQALYMWKM